MTGFLHFFRPLPPFALPPFALPPFALPPFLRTAILGHKIPASTTPLSTCLRKYDTGVIFLPQMVRGWQSFSPAATVRHAVMKELVKYVIEGLDRVWRRVCVQFLPYLSPDMDGFDEIPPAGKLLYLMAQIRPAGSLSALARGAGLGVRNAFRLAKLLKKYGWIRAERRGHLSIPIAVIPQVEDERRARLLQMGYDVAQYKGEFLLTTCQMATIILEGAVYNARPGFLRHPVTEEKLEYDIFNPETSDAWELHGFQHFGPSEIQPSKEKAKQQQANDLIKIGRSVVNNINIAVMTYKDLSLDGVLKKMPNHLPRRSIDRSSRYIRTLERLASNYRQWAARTERRLKARQQAEAEDDPSPAAPEDQVLLAGSSRADEFAQ